MKIEEEVMRMYRELSPQGYIAKHLYLTKGQVRGIINKYLGKEERIEIMNKINRRVSDIRYNKNIRKHQYLLSSIKHLYNEKHMEVGEIVSVLHISQDKVKEILGITNG